MIDSTFIFSLLGIIIFFAAIYAGCWWDLNGYKVIEKRRQARQKLIDAAKDKLEALKPPAEQRV